MNEFLKGLAAQPLMYAGVLLIFGSVGVDNVLEIDPALSNLAAVSGFGLIIVSLWRNRK